ncbi:MAG: hypothetical protein JXA90_05840, partial [Planctomycetes bacterium]|nr:hypothetical protein [Planctomycetota bacterium]
MNPTGRSDPLSRRRFLAATGGAAFAAPLAGRALGALPAAENRIRPVGPGSRYVAKIRAAFVRRRGEYGMRWPGAVYDG